MARPVGMDEVRIALAAMRRFRRPAPGLHDLLWAEARLGLETDALDTLISPPDPGEVLAALLRIRGTGERASARTGPRRLDVPKGAQGQTSGVSSARQPEGVVRNLSVPKHRELRRTVGEIGQDSRNDTAGSLKATALGTETAHNRAQPSSMLRAQPETVKPGIAARRAMLRQALRDPSVADPASNRSHGQARASPKTVSKQRNSVAGNPKPNARSGVDRPATGTPAVRHALVRLAETHKCAGPALRDLYDAPGRAEQAGEDPEIQRQPAPLAPEKPTTPARTGPTAADHGPNGPIPSADNLPADPAETPIPVGKPRPRPAVPRLSDNGTDLAEAAWRNGVDAP